MVARLSIFGSRRHNGRMSQKFFKDKSGKVVLWQTPNSALIGWAVFALLSYLTHSQLLAWIGTTFLLAWAFMELFQGVNFFRRLLGLTVLIVVISSLFR